MINSTVFSSLLDAVINTFLQDVLQYYKYCIRQWSLLVVESTCVLHVAHCRDNCQRTPLTAAKHFFSLSDGVLSLSWILSSTITRSAWEHLPYAVHVDLNVCSLSSLCRKVRGRVMLQDSASRVANYSVTCTRTLLQFCWTSAVWLNLRHLYEARSISKAQTIGPSTSSSSRCVHQGGDLVSPSSETKDADWVMWYLSLLLG